MAIKIIDLERFQGLNLNESSVIRGGSRYISIPPLYEPFSPTIKPTPIPSPPEPVLPTPLPSYPGPN